MESALIHPQGYWLSHEEEAGHVFDPVLAYQLQLLLQNMSVCDFGCGLGKYVQWLKKSGLECDGYDGNPNTNELSFGTCHSLNLAEPVQLDKRYDAVICLEVAEHVPKQYEATFLENLTLHAKDTIVLSWAVPGQNGDGHVNCRINTYVIYQLWLHGFRFQPTTTISLRARCSLPWFPHTLMVFSRTQKPRSYAEVKAAARIVYGDIKRLDRGNSSLVGASFGKIARSIGKISRLFREALTKVNVGRQFLRYDAETHLRSVFDLSERKEAPNEVADRSSRLFPICFTCGKHFELLRVALRSLETWAPSISEVSIYVDKADPLTRTQCEVLLADTRYDLVFHPTVYPMSREGPRSVLNELYAYRKVVARMTVGDFLLKFDSDVIFLSNAIFKFVATSEADAVGCPVSQVHSCEPVKEYMQGGCYFIAAAELRAILDIPVIGTAVALVRERSGIFEDQLISYLLQQCGSKILYNAFMHYDASLSKRDLDDPELEAYLEVIPATASVLHFEGDKFNMHRVAKRLEASHLGSGKHLG